MTTPLEDLIALLTPQRLDADRFRGIPSIDDGWDNVYGGHFLGQATAVAAASAGDDRRVHSLHGYFLRAGRAGQPIDYAVDVVRDGRSFSTRRVTASQNGGPANFELLVSFTVPEAGLSLAPAPPPGFADLPAPESLPRYQELMASFETPPLPLDWALKDRGIDMRIVNAPWSPDGPSENSGIRYWARAAGPLGDDWGLHAAMFAYLSDDSVSDNVLVPFGVTWSTPDVLCVSLDHALWLHRPFRMDEWLFVDQEPLVAAGGRGLANAKVWTAAGELVATFTQEALMRVGTKP